MKTGNYDKSMKKIIALVSVLILIFVLVSYLNGGTDDSNKTTEVAGNDNLVNSEISSISLNGDSITLSGGGATVDGTCVTILSGGTFYISGSLDDGQIIVDTQRSEMVTLILNGVDIACSWSSPLYVMNADETLIVLANGTDNYVTDGQSYTSVGSISDDPNAAIFSKDDLTFSGNGSLTVTAHYNNGIQSKDDLEITSGTITVYAINDGVKGRDSLVIRDGTITVDSGGDGMQSNNDENVTRGYVLIQSGTLDITAGEDGIQAATTLSINGGTISISSGAKGLKAGVDLTIDGGDFTLASSDDCIHSNDQLSINGGNFILSSGDDGIHADSSIVVNGGDISITRCYEGIESSNITINDGTIHLVSTDDGINAVSSTDDGTTNGPPGQPPGQHDFISQGDNNLFINGGYIVIDAAGDGLDINGPISMTGGTVLIHGPTRNDNGALDYTNYFTMTGGFLVAVGSSGMAEGLSTSSSQYSVIMAFSSALPADTLIHIETEDGKEVLTFQSAKVYQSVVLSSPLLEKGETYTVSYGGSSTGSVTDGLYSGGVYTDGTEISSFTISSMVTRLGSSGGGFHGGGGPP